MGKFELLGVAPTIQDIPRQLLKDRGLYGPTVAHKIEEIHTPENIAFITFSTGTNALQNVIGVTYPEIKARCKASAKAFEIAHVNSGDNLLVTYPPLINVFPWEAIKSFGLRVHFLNRSSRMSLLEYLQSSKPSVIIGESSFIYSAMCDADKLGMSSLFDDSIQIIAAGTPLNFDMFEKARERNIKVHDLYGCQEFGWLACDGIPLRNDLSFFPVQAGLYEVIVGGLPTGDIMPISDTGHACNKNGCLITYRAQRSTNELDVVVKTSIYKSAETVKRIARSIMRLKGRRVWVSHNLKTGADSTILELKVSEENSIRNADSFVINGEKTELFDSIAQAQYDYQTNRRICGVWNK